MPYHTIGRVALASTLTNAITRLDKVVATITPDPTVPGKPTLAWGNDLGVFELLNSAANALDRGRDGLSEIFTRREAGRVIDSLTKDVATLQGLRDAALAIDEGAALGNLTPPPSLGPDAVQLISRAVADARTAITLLAPSAG